MLEPVTLPDLFSAISSPVLAAGATPCALPDGPRTDLFGRAVARANPSAPLARKKAPLMIDTSGLSGSISSASAALESSLVSKLKQRLTTDGSTLFKLTWREKATPAGRLVSRLAASARRISGNDFGLWQTPKALDGVFSTPRTTGRPMHRATHLQTQTIALLTNADPTLASWPTPNTPSGGPNVKSTPTHTGGMDLEGAVTLTSWPTPQTMDTLPPMDYEKRLNHPGRPGRTVSGNLREVVTIVGWPTPIVGDTTGGPRTGRKRGPAPGLQDDQLADDARDYWAAGYATGRSARTRWTWRRN
jgi:hypothetical protein